MRVCLPGGVDNLLPAGARFPIADIFRDSPGKQADILLDNPDLAALLAQRNIADILTILSIR
jgi:hypothetical protein